MVADDCVADRALLRAALRQAPSLNMIAEVGDGSEVIAYLLGEEHFEDRTRYPLPDLLLLDLKMPAKDGFEVLKWLRKQPVREGLTIVVLTDSMHPEHIKRALDLGADLFQVKPRAHHERTAMILALEDYLNRREARFTSALASQSGRATRVQSTAG